MIFSLEVFGIFPVFLKHLFPSRPIWWWVGPRQILCFFKTLFPTPPQKYVDADKIRWKKFLSLNSEKNQLVRVER